MKLTIIQLKNIFLTGIVLLVSVLHSCKEVEKLATIQITNSTVFNIPGAVPVNTPYTFLTPDTDNPNQSKAILVRKATLDKVTLTVTSPSGQTFQFIKSLRFFLQAEGLPEIEVANQFNIDSATGNTLILNVTGAELKEYLKRDKFRLRTEVVTDEAVAQPVKIKADLGFSVVILA